HGASDLLEINTKISNKTILIPFTRKIVPKVDIQKSLVIVDPPEGLFSND
ncbi:MAG: ribosome maturation factor RimM, partial [Alphaproteobacteria bacterium]|nr:ribosome maturation factor RimM [Alphaproteobacteria bacterium]